MRFAILALCGTGLFASVPILAILKTTQEPPAPPPAVIELPRQAGVLTLNVEPYMEMGRQTGHRFFGTVSTPGQKLGLTVVMTDPPYVRGSWAPVNADGTYSVAATYGGPRPVVARAVVMDYSGVTHTAAVLIP